MKSPAPQDPLDLLAKKQAPVLFVPRSQREYDLWRRLACLPPIPWLRQILR